MKTNKPLKRKTPFRSKTPLKARGATLHRKTKENVLKGQKQANKRKSKTVSKGYKAPKWFNMIPLGSHGTTPAQKRYWKVCSDTYRQEDYETYKGKCPLCHKHIEDWKQLQLGHFHRWSVSNSWFKFERKNLLGICAACNVHDGGLTSYRFAEVLKQKYGKNHIEWIEKTNECFRGQKMEVWELVERTAKLRPDLVEE